MTEKLDLPVQKALLAELDLTLLSMSNFYWGETGTYAELLGEYRSSLLIKVAVKTEVCTYPQIWKLV